jgi:hypothetical protein
MAEVEYSSVAKLPVETIWEFVQEMDNWAPSWHARSSSA